MKKVVFVSYKSPEDLWLVEWLEENLSKTVEFRYWSKNKSFGESNQIWWQKEIGNADLVFVVITKNLLTSPENVYLEKDFAEEKNRKIIPLNFEVSDLEYDKTPFYGKRYVNLSDSEDIQDFMKELAREPEPNWFAISLTAFILFAVLKGFLKK